MATLIDNAGTQHYANKMVLAENRKVGNKSLPSALADVDNLIEEMKGHFEAEYGSALDMKLENSENVFSVGTGSGVDKREEVENSFTDIEIKGRTLQNLSPRKSLPTRYSYLVSMIKPSTTYTVIYNYENQNESGGRLRVQFETTGQPTVYFGERVYTLGMGLSMYSFVSPSTFERSIILAQSYEVDGTFNTDNIMILEGDYTNTPLSELPYIEGIQSVGEQEDNVVEVKSCGKNLLSGLIKGGIDSTNGEVTAVGTHKQSTISNKIYVDISSNYLFSNLTKEAYNFVAYYGLNDEFLGRTQAGNNDKTIGASTGAVGNPEYRASVFPKNTHYVIITVYMNTGINPNITSDEILASSLNTQIEQSSSLTATPYEPYQEDTAQITLEEPLRSLPNGVCDEIKDGKLIRRVGKVVLDGSERIEWNLTVNDDIPCFWFLKKNLSNCLDLAHSKICDRFPYTKDNFKEAALETLCENTNEIHNMFIFKTNKINTIDEWILWLSQNPTTVYYELAEPVITELPTPSLQCWKNGAISIDSTVPPTTTHTVALNKPAQIKRNIEELTALRDRVLTLEEQYDQIALEQAHKLQLLNHSFELDYNI